MQESKNMYIDAVAVEVGLDHTGGVQASVMADGIELILAVMDRHGSVEVLKDHLGRPHLDVAERDRFVALAFSLLNQPARVSRELNDAFNAGGWGGVAKRAIELGAKVS